MQIVIYFLLALFATTVGSLTGMGGGVIIKPLMDILGDYNVQTIGIVSSITVFSVAIVSVLKQIKANPPFPFKNAISLGLGSVAGGFFGAGFNKKCSKKTVETTFNCVQLLVLGITVFNVIRNLI